MVSKNLRKKIGLVFLFFLVIGTVSLYAQKQRLLDSAALLDSQQAEDVQARLQQVSSVYDTDLFILTLESLDGLTPKRYAENFFWGNNHGTADATGVVLLISMAERDVWVATFGRAIDTFQSDIRAIVADLTNNLSSERYYEAFLGFADWMEKPLLEIVELNFIQRLQKTATSFVPWLVALVLTVLIVVLLSLNSRGKRLTTNKTYEVPGSFKLSASHDTYLRTTRTRTKVSSSGSSGSGGRSSGGGGGKF